MDRDVERLPPSYEQRLRARNEALPHPDYPNPHDPVKEQQRDAQAATSRRIAREAEYWRTTEIAGHNFTREARERDDRER